MSARFFISYPREKEELVLAEKLQRALRTRGHEAFVDQDLTAGTQWSTRIDAELRKSDVLVLLITKNTLYRAMVAAEVKIAQELAAQEGRPRVVPVRCRYTGALSYQFEAYVGTSVTLTWDDPEAVAGVVGELERAAQEVARPEMSSPPTSAPGWPAESVHEAPARPMPAIDPRWWGKGPGGAMEVGDRRYVLRDEDKEAQILAANSRGFLVVVGPHQCGKSSLLMQYLAACNTRTNLLAYIDLALLYRSGSSTLADVCVSLERAMLDALQLRRPKTPARTIQEMLGSFKKNVLAKTDEDVVVVLDRGEAITDAQCRMDVYTMLRSWHDHGAREPWSRLSLALSVSTDPSQLIDDAGRSPLNNATILRLGFFSLEQCRTLNARFPNPLSPPDLERIFKYLGGHPYLTRLAYYELWQGTSLEDLLASRGFEGVFGDHLRAILRRISKTPKLVKAMKALIDGGKADPILVDQLWSLGLARKVDHERYEPSSLLYANFFGKVR